MVYLTVLRTTYRPPVVINHHSAGGLSESKQEPCKNGCVKLNHLHMHQGSPLIPIFRALSRSLRRHLHPSPAEGHFHTILMHFISKNACHLPLVIPHASAPYNAVGTVTYLYGHLLAFFINLNMFSTLFSAPLALAPHSFTDPQPLHTFHPLTPETPGTQNNQLPLTVHHLVKRSFNPNFKTSSTS